MNAIQQIEEILGIKLEKKRYGKSYDPNQKNTYSLRREHIESLRLDNVVIDDFATLLPHLEKLSHLKINDSTIQNFSELLSLRYADLRLNKVIFKNNDCDITGALPRHLIFSNMQLDAVCLRGITKNNVEGFRQTEFKNCHIDNIQEIDNLDQISLLIFDNITFTHQPKEASKKATRRLMIHNTNFADVAFLPFSDSIENIEFENCQIGSIAGLTRFPKLDEIRIDSDTTIEDKSSPENPFQNEITCIITQGKRPLDLREIISLKDAIYTLHLHNYEERSIDFIGEFKNVKHLSFYESKAYIDAFLPIAKQIETISFTQSIIKKYNYFGYFKNLVSLESTNYDEDNRGLSTFKKIRPLKRQLKVLEIYDHQKIHASHLIKEFTALESLKIAYEVPVQTAEYILTLQNLKKLSLSIEEKDYTLSLEKLKKLEFLILEADNDFVGFEHLTQLKSLKIGDSISTPVIDVNALPRMESLQRLNLVSYDYEIKGLAQFPNLEALRLKGAPKVQLGKLEKLKVLSLENSSIEGFSTFEELPSLEKLDLSSIYNKLNLEGFHKFRNLQYLTFLESEVDDISHLEPLKKLEYLDLYCTAVSDVQVLNTLPNLKEVNLAVLGSKNLEKQLEKPEIAIYCGLPAICIWIWEEDEFGV